MARHMLRHPAHAVLTLFVRITLVFFVMRMPPDAPPAGRNAAPTAPEAMSAQYGLDTPLPASPAPRARDWGASAHETSDPLLPVED